MNFKFKRIVSIFLVFVLMCTVMPLITVPVQAAGMTLQQLQIKYPHSFLQISHLFFCQITPFPGRKIP